MSAPRVGDPLPDFEARLPDGGVWRSAERRGRPLVLYFYPKDFTAGCTREACDFRDAYEELHGKLGAELVGISRDDGTRHERFRAEHRLPFPLLSDPGGAIAARFGATHLGGLLPLTKRVTFVADAAGVIRGVFHHELAIGRHVRKVRECLERMGPTSSAP
jgi:peroxiredoxin Q/BCP